MTARRRPPDRPRDGAAAAATGKVEDHLSPARQVRRPPTDVTHEPDAIRDWLLLIYRVPQDPPGRRSYVWRQLKQLGAVYLQQAAAVLPDTSETHDALTTLADRIRAMDGEVSLLRTGSPNREWEDELVARFNQARDAEYQEIVESVERFEDEIRRESRKGRFTFAELEESETDWEKLHRWQERVEARDFFGAEDRTAAEGAMERGRRALDAFTREVFVRENLEVDDPGHGREPSAGRPEPPHA